MTIVVSHLQENEIKTVTTKRDRKTCRTVFCCCCCCKLHIWYSTPADNHTNEICLFGINKTNWTIRVRVSVWVWVQCDRHVHLHIDLLVFKCLCCANACLHVTFQTSSFCYVQCAVCVCVCCNYDYYCWHFFTILWHRRWSLSAVLCCVCQKTYICSI